VCKCVGYGWVSGLGAWARAGQWMGGLEGGNEGGREGAREVDI